MAIYCQWPKGRSHRISLGKRVKDASNAIAMPSAVKTPKKMVGRKFDSTNMENPAMMVIAV